MLSFALVHFCNGASHTSNIVANSDIPRNATNLLTTLHEKRANVLPCKHLAQQDMKLIP